MHEQRGKDVRGTTGGSGRYLGPETVGPRKTLAASGRRKRPAVALKYEVILAKYNSTSPDSYSIPSSTSSTVVGDESYVFWLVGRLVDLHITEYASSSTRDKSSLDTLHDQHTSLIIHKPRPLKRSCNDPDSLPSRLCQPPNNAPTHMPLTTHYIFPHTPSSSLRLWFVSCPRSIHHIHDLCPEGEGHVPLAQAKHIRYIFAAMLCITTASTYEAVPHSPPPIQFFSLPHPRQKALVGAFSSRPSASDNEVVYGRRRGIRGAMDV
ncbi:hypothetical protein MIND_01252500 [Mycena indigotica]|uniref:Uncharacterized protein n=1 Tax=Mycena indigotica TaxID=2126181 RepID=A0A8H6S3T3_9AGAR|nr:uncharacterized protein MIND_01252500 [Mycena indigotica]KAF7292251.1 hypothetical protein MIND_01252500 [Mycena indigotica]